MPARGNLLRREALYAPSAIDRPSQLIHLRDTQALTFLLDILASGTAGSRPAYLPTPAQFAVAVTCLVHPATTTRARTPEEKDAPAAALRLLRLVNKQIGPKAARFGAAFAFTHFESSRHGATRRRGDEGEETSQLNEDTVPLNLELGQSGALWSRTEDFWQAVGWAFNCSVLHPARWEVWRLWLEFMCEVLEDDWNERLRRVESARQAGSEKSEEKLKRPLRKSLLFRYIEGGSAGYGQNRRILRAIFADGGPGAVGEFREVFHKELKSLNRDANEENIKKREAAVNINEGQFGDYLTDDNDDSGEETSTSKQAHPRPQRASKRPRRSTHLRPDPTSTPPPPTPQTTGLTLLGGPTSLSLRQRLLTLLTHASDTLPATFIPLDDLYHLFVENIRHLPLPIYQTFLAPTTLPHFTSPQQITLAEYILSRILESSAPRHVEPFLTAENLVSSYLPYTAGSGNIADNAKVSIALETMVVLLAQGGMLVVTDGLRDAVQRGIVARGHKAQGDGRKRESGQRDEEGELVWLVESAERLMFLVEEIVPQKGMA